MHLFLDANKLLSFYGLPKSELAELEKLIALVKDGTITLHVTDQVIDEVRRNRAKVLAQLRKSMSDARLQAHLPDSTDQFAQRPVLETALKEAQKRHSDLLQAFDSAVRARTLAADSLLDELFAAC